MFNVLLSPLIIPIRQGILTALLLIYLIMGTIIDIGANIEKLFISTATQFAFFKAIHLNIHKNILSHSAK